MALSAITQLWHLHVLLALSGVTAAATTLVPAQTVITLWFNKNRGRAMGFTLMGIGLGGMALPPLVAWFVLFPMFFHRYARAFWLTFDCYWDHTELPDDTPQASDPPTGNSSAS